MKNKNPPKIVFLYTRIDQAVKLGVDPSLLIPVKYDGCNGVWDDTKKKFVKPGTLDWSWTKKLDCTFNRLLKGLK